MEEDIITEEYFTYSKELLRSAFNRAYSKAKVTTNNPDDKVIHTIWNFLQSRRIRRRNYLTTKQKQQLRDMFFSYAQYCYSQKKPLVFYLFDLPIKNSQGQSPDLGEEILFRNLENIAVLIESVYPYGAIFLVLSDGDIFSLSNIVDHSEVSGYISANNHLINKIKATRVTVRDWHTYIYEDEEKMHSAFNVFKTIQKYEDYLSTEIQRKTRIRCAEITKGVCTKKMEDDLLFARAFFEMNKRQYFENTQNPTLGFKLTKGGFKRESPVLAIYPADPNIETSVSRGKTTLIKKESGTIVPVLN